MNLIQSELVGNVLHLKFLKNEMVFSISAFILESIEKKVVATSADTVVLDLSNVFIIDSSAVGMFLSLKNMMEKLQKDFILEGLTNNVRRILNLLEITDFLCVA